MAKHKRPFLPHGSVKETAKREALFLVIATVVGAFVYLIIF